MFWTESAVRTPDLLARSAPDAASTIPYVNAYRCGNGHTSQECPLCGSFDTAAWRDPAPSSHYHVICAACGNDALVTR